MKITTPITVASALVACAALAAGCGGRSSTGSTSSSSGTPASSSSGGYGYGGGSSASTTTATMASSSGRATIALKSTSLGRILVDGKGMSIYLFEKDTGTKSACSGSCATFWPPVTTKGAAKAGSGIMAAKLGTTTRSDGTTQVTYNGHPLYYYTGDKKPGDVTGQGLNAFGAVWYVLSPAGQAVT